MAETLQLDERMHQKIAFIAELDKLKAVLRQTKPTGLARFENSAEHSWHAALTAMVLLEEASSEVDPLKVLKMLLIHDVVEIDCGDVFTYDEAARAEIAIREEAAARRIFGMLPRPYDAKLLDLWLEFEASETPSAKFAKAVDKVCPVVQNLSQGGESWVRHGINRERVIAKNESIQNASPDLWSVLRREIDDLDVLPDA